MKTTQTLSTWCGALALLAATAAQAQTTVVVTTPAGVAGSGAQDAWASDVWSRYDIRGDALTGITDDFARSGNGSAYLYGNGAPDAANWAYAPAAGFGLLADLGAVHYDWYRASTSTVAAHLHPALKLYLTTEDGLDVRLLVFERAYNGPPGPLAAAPVDAWQTDAIGDTSVLWANTDVDTYCTLLQFKTATCTNNQGIGPNSQVLGIVFGIGSGWGDAVFEGAVDNVRIGDYQANFELQAAPGPVGSVTPVPTMTSAWLLGLLSLCVGAGVLRSSARRRG